MSGDQFVYLILAAIAFAAVVELAIAAHRFWVHSGHEYDQAITQAEYERRDS